MRITDLFIFANDTGVFCKMEDDESGNVWLKVSNTREPGYDAIKINVSHRQCIEFKNSVLAAHEKMFGKKR